MFPGYVIHAVTNGIHSYTWTCESFKQLFNRHIPGWANEPEMLVRIDGIPDEEIWRAHLQAKDALFDYVKKANNVDLDKGVLTLGFARRATEYKRGDLIFSDLEKLRRVNSQGKLQFVFAGKAHPKDEVGKKLIKRIFDQAQRLKEELKIVYLENYDIDIASKLVSGVDVWLNTPLPPQEASGTSGMKAAHNGVINFSVLDGWWIEGWIEGITGWSIGPRPEEGLSLEKRGIMELDDLYGKLEHLIVPMFYSKGSEWVKMMKNSIGKIAYYFNSHRMMRRYVTEAYL